MRIACTMAPGRGDTDLLLFSLAEGLARAGIKTVGTVQINTDTSCNGPCDMDVRLLPDGPDIRISQSLGREAKGCRLNPDALETAVQQVSARLQDGADCLIVNKFGKHEADGRGFRDVIAQAIALELPVLVGLNALNQARFSDFVGGSYENLPPTPEALRSWIEVQINRTQG